jgi:ABC-2 type transport system ATP-binding protein
LTGPRGQLSKGNRQKIGLVLAFTAPPELLALDEPTSGLDPLMRSEFERLVREVTGEGRTVFLSSHDLDEVRRLADQLAIIREGRLITTQTVGALRASAPRIMHVRSADLSPPCAWYAAILAFRRLGVGEPIPARNSADRRRY